MDFNRTVQEHRVKQLFLNVIRASKRQPMAITAISGLKTTNSVKTATGSVQFNFGPLSSGPYKATSPSASTSVGPTLELGILDNNSEFVEGFQKGVPIDVIEHFTQQGWNRELLAFLLIESIRFHDEPPTRQGSEFVRGLHPDSISYIEREMGGIESLRRRYRDDVSGQIVLPNDPSHEFYWIVRNSIHAQASRIRFTGGKTTVAKEAIFTGSMEDVERYVGSFSGSYKTEQLENGLVALYPKTTSKREIKIGGSRAEIVIRSAQNMLYYLGEMVRLQEEGLEDAIPKIGAHHSSLKGPFDQVTGGEFLFFVQRGPGGAVTTKHQGTAYSIPHYPPNRALSSLSFIQQIIMLQQGEIKPTTTTIQVVGGL